MGSTGALTLRDLTRAPGRVRRLGVARAHAADPAEHLPLAQRQRRQRDSGALGGRHVRGVLPRLALPRARARLLAAGDRPGVPAGDRRHGDAVGPLLRAPGDAVRRAQHGVAGHGADRRGAVPVRPSPVDGIFVRDVLPAMLLLGARGHRVPGPDEPRDVRRKARGGRLGIRSGQHVGTGRRRARSRGAGDAVVLAQRRAARRRGIGGVGALRAATTSRTWSVRRSCLPRSPSS